MSAAKRPPTKAELYAQLCVQFESDKEELLRAMGKCTEETPFKELYELKHRWKCRTNPKNKDEYKGFMREVESYASSIRMDGVVRYFDEVIYADPRWESFQKLRTRAYHQSKKFKKRRVKSDHNHYINNVKPLVRTREEKDLRNQNDRERRAKRKQQAQDDLVFEAQRDLILESM